MILSLFALSFAQIAPECAETAAGDAPSWYVDDEAQQNFLLNYFVLSTTFSPLHPPIPNKEGHGTIGLEVAVIPPLNCDRRLVLSRGKTEDTNKAPAAPRPRVSFSFPKIGKTVLYGGFGYIPPVTVFGTRNVITSGELGFGRPLGDGFSLGARYHYTLMKTVAEIATPFVEGEDPYLDFFSGSSYGLDVLAGKDLGEITPYLALGFTNAATFFWIGDDAVVSNNTDPYNGLTFSLGAQGHIKKVQLAGEFYGAPKPLTDAPTEDAPNGSRPHLYTGRLRASWMF